MLNSHRLSADRDFTIANYKMMQKYLGWFVENVE